MSGQVGAVPKPPRPDETQEVTQEQLEGKFIGLTAATTIGKGLAEDRLRKAVASATGPVMSQPLGGGLAPKPPKPKSPKRGQRSMRSTGLDGDSVPQWGEPEPEVRTFVSFAALVRFVL